MIARRIVDQKTPIWDFPREFGLSLVLVVSGWTLSSWCISVRRVMISSPCILGPVQDGMQYEAHHETDFDQSRLRDGGNVRAELGSR
jgi:hypothetical protein